jgi:hypothetical protein
MKDSKYSRLRMVMLIPLLASLLISSHSKGQIVEFHGHGVRQHILKSVDSYNKRALAYEKADVNLILKENSLLLVEKYAVNEVDSVLFEIKNEVFNGTAFNFDLIDIKNPERDIKGQFKPREGEFVILSYDMSIAVVYLNFKRKKTSSEQMLDNKTAWENRGLME